MKYIVYFITLINCVDAPCPDNKPGCMVGHMICDTDTVSSRRFKTLKEAEIFADTSRIFYNSFYVIDSTRK